jgi:hypothetical protein
MNPLYLVDRWQVVSLAKLIEYLEENSSRTIP